MSSRVKELVSLVAKAQNKGVIDPFAAIKDIAGARIVCLFRSDLSKIEDIINSKFSVIERDDKITDGDGFGYMSIHYICKIPEGYIGPRYDHIRGKIFELQTRTLCMDAWAVVSHYLDYKDDWDVPADLKKAMNALSGLFYVADNQFEQVYGERLKSQNASTEMLRNTSNVEINLDTLRAYIEKRFPNRDDSHDAHISELIYDLKETGYTNINQIENDINKAEEFFIEYENILLSNSYLHERFSKVGAVRVAISIANEKMEKLINAKADVDIKPYDAAFLRPIREKYVNKYRDNQN
ncbi:GTP pyrophosphokinase [Methylobacterium aquaticum]|nr:hypothetical protein [Methylobacterium aquaticum]